MRGLGCRYGPPGLAEKYTSEMCWEDFMLGMIVFYPTYEAPLQPLSFH